MLIKMLKPFGGFLHFFAYLYMSNANIFLNIAYLMGNVIHKGIRSAYSTIVDHKIATLKLPKF